MTYKLIGSKLQLFIHRSNLPCYLKMSSSPSSVRFLHEKAYVNGQWVDAGSGKKFDGKFFASSFINHQKYSYLAHRFEPRSGQTKDLNWYLERAKTGWLGIW